jgi:imidazole glycerol phosphate synthase subunit HisF
VTSVDPTSLSLGFRDAMQGKAIFTPEQADQVLRGEMQKMMRKKIQPNIDACNGFLVNNAKREGVKQTASGLQYEVIKEGADRILIESIFNDRVNEVKMISNYIGSQSIILSLPLTIDNNMLHRFDYRNNKKFFFKNFFIDSTNLVSEILIIDYKNEGYQNKFNEKIIEKFPNLKIPIIAYGGVFGKKKIKNLLNNKKINAIAIGNILNYTENSIKKIKLANKNYLRL